MADCSKWQNDLVLDAALDYIATSTYQAVLSDQPSNYTQLSTSGTYRLADEVMTGADFSKSDGAVNGRRVTIAEQATITIDYSETATGVGLGITVGTVLVFVTTCTDQALVASNTVTIPAWTITFADVTA
jgi:hypothetical protein